MKRRSFLKGLAGAGLVPFLPSLSLPGTASAATTAAAAPTAAAATLTKAQLAKVHFAEYIVRCHDKCSVDMLVRHLQVDQSFASFIHDELLRKGVIHPQANAFGIHKATKPFFEGAFAQQPQISKPSANTASLDGHNESDEPALAWKEWDVSGGEIDHIPEEYRMKRAA